MDRKPPRRIADSRDYRGVEFGKGVVLYGQSRIGSGTRIGDYSVIGRLPLDDDDQGNCEGETVIESDVAVGAHCIIESRVVLGKGVRVSDHCFIGSESRVGEYSRVTYRAQLHWNVNVGDHSIIGGFCCDRSAIGDRAFVFGTLVHRFADPTQSWDETQEPSPIVEEGAVVGFGALLIGNVIVGRGAYVAAGAIVTRNVPPRHIQIGRQLRTLSDWEQRKKEPSG